MTWWGRVVVAVVLATPFVATPKVAADGEPVAGFGVNGVMIDSTLSSSQVYISDALQLADGSFIAAGTVPLVSNGPSAFLVKYLASGVRDPQFGVGGVMWGTGAEQMASFPDGRVLTWSSGTSTHGATWSIVTPTGQLLPGPAITGNPSQLLPRPDGSIIAIGFFASIPIQQSVVRIISPSGAVDDSFDSNVDRFFPRPITPELGPPVFAASGTLMSDGRLIVSISNRFKSALRPSGCTLVAFDAGGGIDDSFGAGGAVDVPVPYCTIDKFIDDDTLRVLQRDVGASTLLYSPHGTWLATLGAPFDDPALTMEGTGYSYALLPGQSSVISYDPIGNVDTTFGLNGVADLPGMRIRRIKVLPSGDLLAFGWDGANLHGALGLIHASYGTALQPPAISTSKFVPLPPKRMLDTRDGTGAPLAKLGIGNTLDLQITGVAGVPATDVSAVVLNVTATEATQSGYVSIYPSGTRRPLASNLNLDRVGQTAANLVTVKVGGDGKVTLFSSGGTHLVADLAGYYTTAVTSTDGRLQTATPERILDTRIGLGAPMAKLGAGQQIDLKVTGHGPIPSVGVSTVVLNITGDQATVDGFITAWPAGIDRPVVSNLNLTKGETRANLVIVPIGADGKISLFTSGGTDLIADVAGWFTDATAPDDSVGLFVPITPTRLLDTRHEPIGPTAPTTIVTRLIGSTTVVPPDSSIAVVANITATDSTGPGYITAWPANTPLPLVSNLNTTRAGQTIPNAAIVPLSHDELSLYTQSGAQLIIDISGWYTNN